MRRRAALAALFGPALALGARPAVAPAQSAPAPAAVADLADDWALLFSPDGGMSSTI